MERDNRHGQYYLKTDRLEAANVQGLCEALSPAEQSRSMFAASETSSVNTASATCGDHAAINTYSRNNARRNYGMHQHHCAKKGFYADLTRTHLLRRESSGLVAPP
eukprot:6171394-Pleurochrysis_carterae.AAC.2